MIIYEVIEGMDHEGYFDGKLFLSRDNAIKYFKKMLDKMELEGYKISPQDKQKISQYNIGNLEIYYAAAMFWCIRERNTED